MGIQLGRDTIKNIRTLLWYHVELKITNNPKMTIAMVKTA